MVDKKKALEALKELTQKIESGDAKVIGLSIQAEIKTMDLSDFDERKFEHVDTGIRNLIVKHTT